MNATYWHIRWPLPTLAGSIGVFERLIAKCNKGKLLRVEVE